MKKLFTAIMFCPVLLCFSLLSGCATIVSGTSQRVSVTTAPVSGAMCSLTNPEGTWYISTPSSVVSHKSVSFLDIECKKAGYYDGKATIKSRVKPAFFGNALFGGGIGLGIDAYDGAGFSYPTNIQVPMMIKSN